jgi:hypothetical protein
MSPPALDLTDLALAARSNDPRVVGAFGESFPAARFHLPLTTLDGVKNRPETAVELGASLPVPWLRLDNGELAVPLFTRVDLCRRCAETLSWKTEGRRAIGTLALPGLVALTFSKELLMAPGVDRVILNPSSDGMLHLARTDVGAMALGHPLRSLWFYTRNGTLKVPVEIEGGSFLGTMLTRADRAIQKWTDGTGAIEVAAGPLLGGIPREQPLGGLATELYRLLTLEGLADAELTVTKSKDEVRVTTRPETSVALRDQMTLLATKHLVNESEGTLRFILRSGTIVLTSTASAEGPEKTAKEPAPPKRTAATSFSYIPLEPEPLDED